MNRQRLAVASMFFVNGAVLANWVSQVPVVQEHLHLSSSLLGIGLLGMSTGAIGTLAVAGRIIGRLGSRRVATGAGIVFCLSLLLPLQAPSLPTLFITLALFGAANAAMDVAMNAQGVMVERQHAGPLMSSFHASWSVGALAGALLSGFVDSRGVTPDAHLFGASVTLGILTIAASFGLLSPANSDPLPPRVKFTASLRGPLRALSIIAFCLFLSEGAVADWSAVYLRHSLVMGAGLGTTGFAAFSLFLTVGRLVGDRLVGRVGPIRMLRVGGAIVAVGFGISLLLPVPVIAIVGFACVGAGLANGVPIVFSVAGRFGGQRPAGGIAAVAAPGYFGSVVGPPVIGFVAQVTSLRAALGLIPLLAVFVIGLASYAVRRADVDQLSPRKLGPA